MLLCLSLVLPVWAEEGDFQVVDGEVTLFDGVYYLDAHVDYRLGDAAREALENGVPLVVELQIQVINPRWWWWDESVAALAQRYRLQHHAISERYVVTAINSGKSRSFRRPRAMLEALGLVESLPIIDAGLLAPGENYVVRVRARLDADALPRPLRAMAYISPDWQLVSDWRSWQLGSL